MKKHAVILFSAAILGISGITAAYIFTDNNTDINVKEALPQKDETAEIYHPVVTVEPYEEPPSVYYMLTAENEALKLYEVNGENKKAVKTAEITPDMFPKEDIELLKNGIHALSLEEGIEIMENFIS